MGDEDGEESVVFVVDLVAVVEEVDVVVVVVVVVVSFPEWMNVDTASGCLASANTIVSFLVASCCFLLMDPDTMLRKGAVKKKEKSNVITES